MLLSCLCCGSVWILGSVVWLPRFVRLDGFALGIVCRSLFCWCFGIVCLLVALVVFLVLGLFGWLGVRFRWFVGLLFGFVLVLFGLRSGLVGLGVVLFRCRCCEACIGVVGLFVGFVRWAGRLLLM